MSAPLSDRSQPSRPRHVLLVEDDKQVAMMVAEMLRGLGCEPVIAGDAETAMVLFARGQFDTVITDLHLPAANGIELAQLLLARQPDLTVVLASGRLTDADSREAERLGVHEVLHKPFTLAQLAHTLRQPLHHR